jgi:uncharacterized membrane-anchored protein YhcB (DUF1043 family)
MTISLADLIGLASLILSVVALVVTIIGFFASLKFYKDGVALQDSATKALSKIEEKTNTIGQQMTGMFDKTLDAAINKGGQINQVSQDFEDIQEQIDKVSKALIEKASTELTSLGSTERERLKEYISEQFKNITDQVVVTQENATEIVSTPDTEFVAISQFQAKILDAIRGSSSALDLTQISAQVSFSEAVVEKAISRLLTKKLIIENAGKYTINQQKEKQDLSLIDKAFQSASLGGRQVLLSKIGLHIQQINPTFDARAYGYENLSDYLRKQNGYKLIDNFVNGYNHPIVEKV